jgi:hypothetical protein
MPYCKCPTCGRVFHAQIAQDKIPARDANGFAPTICPICWYKEQGIELPEWAKKYESDQNARENSQNSTDTLPVIPQT